MRETPSSHAPLHSRGPTHRDAHIDSRLLPKAGKEPLPEGNGQGGRELWEEKGFMVSLAGQVLLWAKSSSQQGAAPGHSLLHHISSFFQHLRFPHTPRAGTQPCCLLLPSPHPSPASAPRKESSRLERVCGATSSPSVEHPGTQHRRPQGIPAQTEGGPNLILRARNGPDLVTAACTQHGQEPGSVGTLAPWTSPPH